jgi:hypothetical protein
MEAINRPWHFTASGRLVTAVGKRVKDEKLVYVDSTGSWCKSDGTYQTPGEPRPMQHSALLDKQLEVPASLYNFLLDTTDTSLHITLPNGAVLLPLQAVSPTDGPTVYLSPKGKVVNECGLTDVTWKKHRRGPALPRLKPLPRSIGASRVHALGAVPLRKATVVATPTLVTIRKLREAYGHTRSKRSHEG